MFEPEDGVKFYLINLLSGSTPPISAKRNRFPRLYHEKKVRECGKKKFRSEITGKDNYFFSSNVLKRRFWGSPYESRKRFFFYPFLANYKLRFTAERALVNRCSRWVM